MCEATLLTSRRLPIVFALEKVLKEGVDIAVRLLIGRMLRAIGHADPILVAEKSIDGNRMIQRCPAGRWIGFTAGHEKRSRRHQRVQFVKVSTGRNELWISSFGGRLSGHGASFGPRGREVAQVPRVPVVN